MKFEIRDDVRTDVNEYLCLVGESQAAMQNARQQLKFFQLGRSACTSAEQELVEVVYSADKVLRAKLSATLRANRRKPEENY